MKNTHGRMFHWRRSGVFIVNFEACDFAEGKTPPWVFFTFLKLYKWYQIAQNMTNWQSIKRLFGLPLVSLYSVTTFTGSS